MAIITPSAGRGTIALVTPPVRRPELPLFLQRRHTDEFLPPPYTRRERRAIAGVLARGPRDAGRLGVSLADYWSSRNGTAAGLLALNEMVGDSYYVLPPEAGLDAAIVHAGRIMPLSKIDDAHRKICLDLVHDRRADGYDPLEALIEAFTGVSAATAKKKQLPGRRTTARSRSRRSSRGRRRLRDGAWATQAPSSPAAKAPQLPKRRHCVRQESLSPRRPPKWARNSSKR